jgi:hypothetical protein
MSPIDSFIASITNSKRSRRLRALHNGGLGNLLASVSQWPVTRDLSHPHTMDRENETVLRSHNAATPLRLPRRLIMNIESA